MRKYLRNMARATLNNIGCDHVNKRMRDNWRRVIGAYPVNTVTGKRMNEGYHGKQMNKRKNKSETAQHLFSYTMKPMKKAKNYG